MATINSKAHLPRQIRVSLGSGIILGLTHGKVDAEPSTAYLMTYRNGKCDANCRFCPQARESQGRADMLSRVSWPVYPTELVIAKLDEAFRKKRVKRVCVQALNYSGVFAHLQALVTEIHKQIRVPISVSCQPLNTQAIEQLAKAGAGRIGIPLDAATEKIFDEVKGRFAGGPYKWKKQFRMLEEAVRVFGKFNVSTHLVVGLGETEREMIIMIQRCIDMNVFPALFAFTPIPGTALASGSQPSFGNYRRIQVARHLIVNACARYEDMSFDDADRVEDFGVNKSVLLQIVQGEEPFYTSGCPFCNRPYYNEKPSGPIYNYPRKIVGSELLEIQKQLGLS